MDGTLLNRANQVTYLGFIFDHNWIQDIAYVKNRNAKGVDIMYKARRFLKQSLIN